MRPAALRRATFSLLIWLQTLLARRGVNRCKNELSSYAFRTPSIHPQHSTTSIACTLLIVGTPEPFLYSLSHSSVSRSWFLASQASKAFSVRKLLILFGSTMIGAILGSSLPSREP